VLGGWGSNFSIETHYGRSRFQTSVEYREFPQLSRPALRPSQPPVQWVLGLFPGGKVARVRGWLITPSRAKVQETVQSYLYSPSVPSEHVLGRMLLPSLLMLHLHTHLSYDWFLPPYLIIQSHRLLKAKFILRYVQKSFISCL